MLLVVIDGGSFRLGTRERMLLAFASTTLISACVRSHSAEADGGAGDGRAALHDAGEGADVDSGAVADSVVIDGVPCTAYAPIVDRWLPCEWSESLAGACTVPVDGPWVEHRSMDPCALAESAGGSWQRVLGPPINQVATCDQVAWRWGDATATLHFGGSEPLARAFSQTPVVREVSITATAGEDGCRTVTRVELGDGTDGRHLVIGEGPPGLGRFPFGEILFELTWAGPACDPEPWTQCGAFELGGGEVSWGGALLTPCATSQVPAAIGGCGDAIDIPVSAGPLDCHARVRLGLTWPLWAPLCH